MNDDSLLLRRYADDRSEEAFTELVRRHLNLVYNAALRRTGGDPHSAADVSQQVFTTLARNARRLSRHSVLQAWLHTATRNAALNLMLSEQRRKVRESQATALGAEGPGSVGSNDWERIKPMLDEAIDELPSPDREAVVLRFLEHRDFSEIGIALKLSADAARMRTGRALEKLRALLERRGITSTAAALTAIITSQSLMSAPAGLASSVASAAVASGAGAGIVAGLTSIMTIKTVVTAVVVGVLAYAAGNHFGRGGHAESEELLTYENVAKTREVASLHKANTALQSALDRVDAANIQLNTEVAQLTASNAKLAAMRTAAAAPSKNLSIGLTPRELKRNILNNLQQIDAARSQYKLENGADPASVDVLVGDSSYIRRLTTVGGEDYSGLSMGAGQVLTVTTPDGTVVTYDPSGAATTKITEPPTPMESAQELMQAVRPAINKAVVSYRANNQGQDPPNSEALMPYFSNPQDAVAFGQANEAIAAARKTSH